MERSKKTKTTQEDSQKDSPSDWKEIVYQRNKIDHMFWEESWNDEDYVGFVRRPPTHTGQSNWGVVQLVRASVLYTGSRGFKSHRPNYALVAQLERAFAF